MTNRRAVLTLWCLCATTYDSGWAQAPHASDSVSRATSLVLALDQRSLRVIAAEYSSAPGRFAAAMYQPGLQLLAVSGTYPRPEQMRQLIAAGQFQQVYSDLSSAGAKDGRLFVQDLGANGLRIGREDDDEPFDIVWVNVSERIAFDRESDDDALPASYVERHRTIDARYAELLEALIVGTLRIPLK